MYCDVKVNPDPFFYIKLSNQLLRRFRAGTVRLRTVGEETGQTFHFVVFL